MIGNIFFWWLVIFFLGIMAFPFLFIIFRYSGGRGIFFSKICGILFLTYISWILGRAGIMAFSRTNLLIIYLFLLIISFYIIFRNRTEFFSFITSSYRLILAVEIIFLLSFILFAVIRAYDSKIIGQEKFMDLAFLFSICRTDYFPPPDPWLSGSTINYYYLGYVMNGVITKLSGISVPVAYNLALSSTLSLTVLGCWGVVYGITRSHIAGVFSALLLAISGNNDAFIQVQQNKGMLGFDFFRSSRVIPNTINEFPFFSFILGDLHPHYTSLPVFLFALAICLIWVRDIISKITYPGVKEMLPFLFLSAFTVGSLFAINFWNVPTCYAIIFIAVIFFTTFLQEEKSGKYSIYSDKKLLLIYITAMILLSLFLFFPFFLDFKSPQSLNIKLVADSQRTEISHFLICFAIFIFISILCVFLKFWERLKESKEIFYLSWFYGSIIFLIFIFCLYTKAVPTFIAFMIIVYIYISMEEVKSGNHNNIWFYFIFLLGFFILLGCETFYLKDNYGHPYERMNTIFKFHYQVIVLFSIATGGFIFSLLKKKSIFFFWVTLWIFLIPTLFYPFVATYSRIKFSRGFEIDGMKSYMEKEHPFDYQAITWLNNNYSSLPSDPVMVEATRDSYSYYGRVSTNSGIPSVLGWANHELVWRGSWDEPSKREKDIKLLYETKDVEVAKDIISKYKITCVYVGEMERATYSPLEIDKFYKIMKVIYKNDGTIIFGTL